LDQRLHRFVNRVELSLAHFSLIVLAVPLLRSWAYDIASNTSAWIGGSAVQAPTPPIYGGVSPSPTNGLVVMYGLAVIDPAMWISPDGSLYFGFGQSLVNQCNHLFVMNSPASTVSMELATSAQSTVSSSLAASTRAGVNNITLGWPYAFTQDLNFSVVSEAGVAGQNFTIRIVWAAPSSDNSWSLVLNAPGITSTYLTSLSPASAGIITLPPTAALGVATIQISIPATSTISPPSLSPTLQLSGRGTTSTYSFFTTAQNGLLSPTFTVALTVNFSSSTNWTVVATGAGLTPTIFRSSTSPFNTLKFNYSAPQSISNTSVTYWLSGLLTGMRPSALVHACMTTDWPFTFCLPVCCA
jgi:hypothetical protein